MKKILIIGASILQLPAIKKAKELGYYVGVLDYNPNAIGVACSDEFFNISTNDIDGVVNAAKAFNPDGIMTLATDMPMRSIAAACNKLGLPGISPETAIRATDKGEMIKAFEAAGVEHPWYKIVLSRSEFDGILEKITYPCIIKPTDNAGSRGVVLTNDSAELKNAYEYSVKNSRNGAVIIEEYMRGPEVSVEIIITDGEPHVLAVTDKLTTGSPHFVEMGHSQPSMLTDANLIKIRDLACRAVKAVGIALGPAHVEIILTDEGPKMVELGARMGGDCITTHLVPLSTGIDMVEATIRVACGEEPDILPKFNKGSAIRYLNQPQGIIESISGIDAARSVSGVQELIVTKGIGDSIEPIYSSTDRAGFVIAQGSSAEAAIISCNKATSLINFSTHLPPSMEVSFRALCPLDCNLIYSWIIDPDLRKYTGSKKPESYQSHKIWFKKKLKDCDNKTLIIRYGENDVGLIGTNIIDKNNKNAEMYLYIGNSNYRGHGIGVRAINMFANKLFHELQLHKVTARIFSYNIKSSKAFKKAGFFLDGIQREQVMFSNDYYDLLWYGKING